MGLISPISPMITIDNLKKNFGETIATDIASFTVNDGDVLGLGALRVDLGGLRVSL